MSYLPLQSCLWCSTEAFISTHCKTCSVTPRWVGSCAVTAASSSVWASLPSPLQTHCCKAVLPWGQTTAYMVSILSMHSLWLKPNTSLCSVRTPSSLSTLKWINKEKFWDFWWLIFYLSSFTLHHLPLSGLIPLNPPVIPVKCCFPPWAADTSRLCPRHRPLSLSLEVGSFFFKLKQRRAACCTPSICVVLPVCTT